MQWPGLFLDLDRRLSRKIEGRKTIQLSADDLDLLVVSGAVATFREWVSDRQRAEAQSRLGAEPLATEEPHTSLPDGLEERVEGMLRREAQAAQRRQKKTKT